MGVEFGIYIFLNAIFLIYGLVNLSKLTNPFKYLLILSGYNFASEIGGRMMYYSGCENTFTLYHFNSVVFILLNGYIYWQLLRLSGHYKKVVFALIIGCVILTICNSVFYQDFYTFPSFGIALHCIETISLSLILFVQMINNPLEIPLFRQDIFWLNCGNLIFYSMNFGAFVFYNEYIRLEHGITWLFYLNWVGNLILYICYFWSVYLNQLGYCGRKN